MLFKKIDEASANSITTALNFFELPPTNVSISSSTYREIITLNPVSSKPFHFKIHSSSSFIDLSKCYLLTEMRILKIDAAGLPVNIENTDIVAPIQMIGSTFIKNMRISIDNKEIFDSNGLYAFKAIMDSELSFPNSCKDTFLQTAGYYTDDNDQNSATGAGYLKRVALFAGGKTAQFVSKIDADLFNTPLYLINNIEIDIEIQPNDDAFNILALANTDDTRYKLQIDNCRLYIKTVELMDGLSLELAKKLDTNPARYPIRKTLMKSMLITAGRREFSSMLFSDIIPRRVVVAFVKNLPFLGDQSQSPFNFENFAVRQITLTAGGHNYPSCNYELDYTNEKFVRPYYDMLDALGYANSTESNGITLERYKSGWCFYIFTLSQSQDDEQCFDLIKNGTTSIHVRFNTAIPANSVSLIALGEIDSIMTLDKYRALTTDASV